MALIPQAGPRAGKTIAQVHAQCVKRALAVLAARRKGKTIGALAGAMGVSPERVRQLARKGERFEGEAQKTAQAPARTNGLGAANATLARAKLKPAAKAPAAPAAAAPASDPGWPGLKTGKERRAARPKAAKKAPKKAAPKRPLFVAAGKKPARQQAKRAA